MRTEEPYSVSPLNLVLSSGETVTPGPGVRDALMKCTYMTVTRVGMGVSPSERKGLGLGTDTQSTELASGGRHPAVSSPG